MMHRYLRLGFIQKTAMNPVLKQISQIHPARAQIHDYPYSEAAKLEKPCKYLMIVPSQTKQRRMYIYI